MKQLSKMNYKPDPNAVIEHEPEKLVITDNAKKKVDKLFVALGAIFPAWRVSFAGKSEDAVRESIKNTKLVWVIALVRNMKETGARLNIEHGLVCAEKSESDFLPSVGKFISWCQIASETGENQALLRFNADQPPITYVEQVTRSRCGYKAKRMQEQKGDAFFLKVYREVKLSTPDRVLNDKEQAANRKFFIADKSRGKTIFTRAENQEKINADGLAKLKKLF